MYTSLPQDEPLAPQGDDEAGVVRCFGLAVVLGQSLRQGCGEVGRGRGVLIDVAEKFTDAIYSQHCSGFADHLRQAIGIGSEHGSLIERSGFDGDLRFLQAQRQVFSKL